MSIGKYGVISGYLFCFCFSTSNMPVSSHASLGSKELQFSTKEQQETYKPINYWQLTSLVFDDTFSIPCFSLYHKVLCLIYIFKWELGLVVY